MKMDRFGKNKNFLLILPGLIFLYFLLRVPNLVLQPIFADEAIYIRWAQVMRAEPTLRFLPLTDGKTPLFMWIMIPFFKIFSDPLLAGRILSVIAGFFTLIGVLFLSWQFFNKRVALWASFLMVVTPYILFFDRMALVDSMLSAFTIWALYFSVLLVKKQRIDLAMGLGFFIGGSILTKTPGMFNLLTMPIPLLLINWRSKGREIRILKIIGLMTVSFIISFVLYNMLRLGPGFTSLSSRNSDYIHPLNRLWQYPLDPFIPHFKDFMDFAIHLLTIPVLILVIGGMILSFYKIKENRLPFVLLCWGIIPFIILIALLQAYTARYTLFAIPVFLILAAYFADFLTEHFKKWQKQIAIGILILVSITTLNFDLKLLQNPLSAPMPRAERRGYLEDWTAGYGFKEIANYLVNEAKKESVVVGTEGFFGTLPDGLQIYLDKNRQVVVRGEVATVTDELRRIATEHPTFYVANRSRYLSTQPNLELIKEYPKAIGPDLPPDLILFYRVYPLP